MVIFFFPLIRPPTSSTLFPYTTLFRSRGRLERGPIPVTGPRGHVVQASRGAWRDPVAVLRREPSRRALPDRKSTRLNSSHPSISYAVFCLKKKRGARYRRAAALPPHQL